MQDIEIVRESNSWFAVDKPVGISVHNRNGEDLVSFVRRCWPDMDTAYPINRLDSGTSGIVLFAKTKHAAARLSQELQNREMDKIYHARVQVVKNPPMKGDSGLWRWPLTNRSEGRTNPKGFWKRRIPCQTRWQVEDIAENTASLTINLITGRKHQIRRHAAIFGWPILGDPRYGPKNFEKIHASNLIAKRLSFVDPDVMERITVESAYNL